ncbi:MAG: glycoside hydrolase family 127 protein [Candidatus Saccharicenans sp.]|uniref:glycoside hydrolase family 127 protein n=1 Tax=Candidatus Saccharicenans sp. TaxID=2819258 RepID=UPI0040492097
MKKTTMAWLTILVIILTACEKPPALPEKTASDYPIQPVNFWQVKVTDEFWAPRLDTNRLVTIPYLLRMNEETGRVDNFRIAAGLKKGQHTGKRYNDSDVYKAIEAAAYTLKTHPDQALKQQIDELAAIIAKAQEPDGYLFTTRTIDPKNPAPGSGKERWSNLRVSHELYNLGHLYEAAVAYYQATGERNLLDIALKSADLLVRTFGPGKLRAFPGHQEIEIGLARLYRVTGNDEYLKLAKFFLDERGHYHGGEVYPPTSPFHIYNSEEYLQNHKPVLEQTEAVGHAVRATYMYSGLLDLAALGGYPEYVRASQTLWENVVSKKMYLTGGLGSTSEYEAFGPDYDLPNEKAYAETCAAVGNVFWNQRLFQMEGDGRYVDVLERVIYNGLLSGVGLSGDRFFYQNPLASRGKYERSSWFEVACCPANAARFLATFPQYIYAYSEDEVFINLFVSSTARFQFKGTELELIQETKYPWLGQLKIGVNPARVREFVLCLRIPGWVQGQPVPSDLYRYLDGEAGQVMVRLNRKSIPVKIDRGYLRIKRRWVRGDVLEILFPMPVRRVVAHPAVAENKGRVAIERGPVVFCAEGRDNGGTALNLAVPDSTRFQQWYRNDLLGGVAVITGSGLVVDDNGNEISKQNLFLIPYFGWANRGTWEMAVWLIRKE